MPELIPQNPQVNQSSNYKLIFIIAGFLLVLMLSLLLLDSLKILSLRSLFQSKKSHVTQSQLPQVTVPVQNVSQNQPASSIIAKVGREDIYQQDLTTELSSYPPQAQGNTREFLIKKIIKDSVTLQAADAEGLIHLDNTVFNSPQKDYLKRVKLVDEVKTLIDQKHDMLSGSVITVWFFNTKPAAIGYEKGKELAFTKIMAVYNDVKSGKKTMQQAADTLVNDTSLAQLDPAYKINCYFLFKGNPNEKITFDPGFDTKIKALQKGQISDVYLAKDTDPATHQKIDAIYMFAQLTERNVSGNTKSFEEWYAQKQTGYESITY